MLRERSNSERLNNMQITPKEFIEQVTDEQFATALLTTTADQAATLSKPELLTASLEKFLALLADHKLVQVTQLIPVGTAEARVQLESGIINLPYHNITRVGNFFDDETAEVPLNLYVTVVAEKLNPSGLHIDLVDSIDAVQANKEAALTVLASKVAAQLALLENNLKAADAADQDEDATAEK